MQPVAMNQAALRAPIARLDQLAPSASPTLSDSRRDSLARSGAGTRSVIPRSLTEPESLIGANPAAATVEASLPARVVSLSRTESVLVNQPKPLSSSLPLERRALLIAAPDRSLVATAEVPRPTNNLESTKLPMKSPALPKAASLIEEVIVPMPKSSSSETNALAPSAMLSRRETSGPQPTLSATANGLTTTRAELTTLRTTNRLDAAEIAMLTTKTPPVLLTRRETLVPASVSVAAVDLASGMGTAAPGILLTSTSRLVELLASAPLPAVPRTDSGSPAAAASLQPISQLVLRVARTWTWTATNGLPAATDPTPVIAKSSLPRQVRETVPAELIETIPATP